MRVSEYLVIWKDEKNMVGGTDYIQALNAKQAAEIVKGYIEYITIVEVAKVCHNWK